MKSKQNTLLKRVLIIGFVISMAILACNLPRGSEADEATPTTENQVSVLAINQTLVVITDVATLRSGPGVNFEVLGSLARDEVVNANGISSNGDWYRIVLEDAIDGQSIAWISTEFVEEMDLLLETSVPTVVFTATDTIEFSDALLPSLTPL